MGLEGVELVLSIESEFGIEIDDADAARLVTPRMLADYVIARLGGNPPPGGGCLTQTGFYRLRSILAREFGAPREQVKPHAAIGDFLRNDIRKQWLRLKNAIGAEDFPRLQCRRIVAYPMQAGLPLVGGAMLLSVGTPFWGVVIGTLATCVVATVICDQLASVIPAHAGTVGALARFVASKHREDWSREYVLRRVIHLSAMQLGLSIEKINPDNHYVNDLGLDT